MGRTRLIAVVLICASIVTFGARRVAAQEEEVRASVFGRVVDQRGAPLKDAAITLTGFGAPLAGRTNARGEYRFADVAAGVYMFTVRARGFALVARPGIAVDRGRAIRIDTVATPVAAAARQRGGRSLVDVRSSSVATTITRDITDQLPVQRDFTRILMQSPGVQVDRFNVGGDETGELATVGRTGGSSRQNNYFIDGINVTDLSSVGTTPSVYLNLESVQELSVITGDALSNFGGSTGVTVNFRLKNGLAANTGGLAAYLAPSPFVSKFENALDQRGGNLLKSTQEYGGYFGGPLVPHKSWFFLSGGLQDYSRDTFATGLAVPSSFNLKSLYGTVDYQLSPNYRLRTRLSFGSYEREGSAASDFHAPEAVGKVTGTPIIISGEYNGVINKKLFMTGRYAWVSGGFSDNPVGGPNGVTLLDDDGIYRHGYVETKAERESYQLDVTGRSNWKFGSLNHNLGFGLGYRRFVDDTFLHWPGDQLGFKFGNQLVIALPPAWNYKIDATDLSLFFNDSIRMPKLTLDFGVRWDSDSGRSLPSTVVANPQTSLVPGVDFKGLDSEIHWKDFQYRVGLNYSLDGHKTTLQGGLAKIADHLTIPDIGTTNRLAMLPLWGSRFFGVDDQNHNDRYDPGEFKFNESTFGFPTNSPFFFQSFGEIDPDLVAPTTWYANLGVKHALPVAKIGIDFRYWRTSDILDSRRIVSDFFGQRHVVLPSDYRMGPVFTATNLDGQTVIVRTDILSNNLDFLDDDFLTNGLRIRTAWDIVASALHRSRDCGYIGGWFNYGRSRWIVPAAFFLDGNNLVGSFDDDGAPVGDQSNGSNRRFVFLSRNLSAQVTGMTPKLGFDLAVSLLWLQGYLLPSFISTTLDDNAPRNIQVGTADERRVDDLALIDLRLSKRVRFGRYGVELVADAFNVLDAHPKIQIGSQLNSPDRGQTLQQAGGRVLRVGVKYVF